MLLRVRGASSNQNASLRALGTVPACSARATRVRVIIDPKPTPAGQAVSQPRHWTQASMYSAKAALASPLAATCRISAMRPLGEATSSELIR